jgi:hypothetical protein
MRLPQLFPRQVQGQVVRRTCCPAGQEYMTPWLEQVFQPLSVLPEHVPPL